MRIDHIEDVAFTVGGPNMIRVRSTTAGLPQESHIPARHPLRWHRGAALALECVCHAGLTTSIRSGVASANGARGAARSREHTQQLEGA